MKITDILHEFLHLFGKHWWSKWTDPKPVKQIGGLTAALTGYVRGTAQARFCRICNKHENELVSVGELEDERSLDYDEDFE